MSIVSQGKLVGSKSAAFRKSSTSKPDQWRDSSGHDVGADRNFAHEKAAIHRAAESKAKKERDIINRTKAAAQRAKETLKMAKGNIDEAKRFVYDKPQSHLVKMYDKKPTEDLHAMHKRWSGDHADKKASPSRSEDLLAVHHVLKSRGANPAELPQHKSLGMMRMHEESGTEARVKIKNVARPGDPDPTSEKSTLGKTAQIKTKIIDEEKPTMSVPNFGLSASLIAAARQIVEKKHDDKMMGGKTQVNIEPETNDKIDEGEPKKHTVPKTEKHKKLAALAHPKDKITHKDVLVGRGVVQELSSKEKMKRGMYNKEEVEQVDELEKKTLGSYITKVASLPPEKVKPSREAGIEKAVKKYKMKEDVEDKDTEMVQEADAPRFPITGNAPKGSSERKRKAVQMALGRKNKDHPDWNPRINPQTAALRLGRKLQKEDVELSAEEQARIAEIAKSFPAEVDEAVKKSVPSASTIVSSSIRGANQDQSGFGVKKNTADYTISDEKKVRKEEVELEEAIKIGSKVKVHAPGKDYHGVVGNVGEIDHGLHNKSEKRYTVDYSNRSKSVTVPKSQIKLHKEEVELEEGRGRPRKNPLPPGKEAEGDDTHKHPMQQLEKISHAIEGNEPHFEHKDGSKSKVTKHLARHIVSIHNSMRTSQEKDNFAQKVHANRESMKAEVSKHF